MLLQIRDKKSQIFWVKDFVPMLMCMVLVRLAVLTVVLLETEQFMK